jgi:CheY-like chemotaxis protein
LDTPSALQRILTEAIQSLKPNIDEPTDSPAWETYVPLSYRYVERLRPSEIANQLSISVRHLRRKEHDALEALSDLLWVKYDLESASDMGTDSGAVAEAAMHAPAVDEELDWLKDAVHKSSLDLEQTLPDILHLAQRLADRHGVRLETRIAGDLPLVAVDQVALRQILLNLITVAIPRASGGQVAVAVELERWEVGFRIRCEEYPSGPKPTLDDETDNLNLAQQLAQLCGARLALAVDARTFDAMLTLPAVEQMPVLVIDDNADTLQLLGRFTSGTRYHLIAARDPGAVVSLVDEFSPQIIVLDVMMPGVDGWGVIEQLQQNPLTAHIPIVVCTILAQKELATFLGASAFLRKPVSRQAFLSALDHQIEKMEAGHC